MKTSIVNTLKLKISSFIRLVLRSEVILIHFLEYLPLTLSFFPDKIQKSKFNRSFLVLARNIVLEQMISIVEKSKSFKNSVKNKQKS